MNIEKPTVGRIVHYTLETDRGNVVTRPAIVVNDWGGKLDEGMRINLQVFVDGTNDGVGSYTSPTSTLWKTSIAYDAEGKPNTWRWPPRDKAPAFASGT